MRGWQPWIPLCGNRGWTDVSSTHASGRRGYSYFWRLFAFWPLNRLSSHLPLHISICNYFSLTWCTWSCHCYHPVVTAVMLPFRHSYLQADIHPTGAICNSSALASLQHLSQIIWSSLEVTWGPRFHLTISVTKQKTNPPPFFPQRAWVGLWEVAAQTSIPALSSLPVPSHSVGPQSAQSLPSTAASTR